jgi:prepilin-type N-terminal cleavage/methylation domain-containing protein
MLRNRKGFTLVELMVVAIIVAILAAVLLPMMTGNKLRAYGTEAEAGLGTIKNALRVYWAEHGNYTGFPTSCVGSPSGIMAGDLTGTFFTDACYSVAFPTGTTLNDYLITCNWSTSSGLTRSGEVNTAPAKSVTLDENGVFTRTNY